MSDVKSTVDVYGKVSKHYKKLLDELVKRKNLPVTTLISIAIEKEFRREDPFDFTLDVPTEEYVEFAFATEAEKILNYLKINYGQSLTMLMILRHDIGIEDPHLFHLAFRECLLTKQIESYVPKRGLNSTFIPNEDYVFYRLKGSNSLEQQKIRKEAFEYQRYLKNKKKYEGK